MKTLLFIFCLICLQAGAQTINNAGFESGALSPWSSWNPSGNSVVAASNAHSGTYAITQNGTQTSIEQIISGLTPNASYTLKCWVKVAASGVSISLGVKNYGANQLVVIGSSTTYTQLALTFTMGAANTQATIFLYKNIAGTAFGDDFTLTLNSPPSQVKNYYVDNVNGDDNTHTGLSKTQAWKTIGKINSVSFNPGDSILFIHGGTFPGNLHPLGNGLPGKPIVISKYDGSDLPKIVGTGDTTAAVYLLNQQYWNIMNLDVTNQASPGTKKCGIEVRNANGGKLTHIYIMNNYVHDVKGDYIKLYAGSAGILISVRQSGGATLTPSWYDSVRVENNEVINVCRTGINTGSGWGRTYPFTNVAIRNNYVYNSAGDGILINATASAIVEYNMVNSAGSESAAQGANNAGMWPWDADNTVLQFNEVFNTYYSNDGQAYDIDYQQNGTIFQYNYSHDNHGGFLLVCRKNQAAADANTNGIVRYNISQNDQTRLIHISGSVVNVKIYNNTLYVASGNNAKPLVVDSWGGYPTSVSIQNNIFYLQGDTETWDGWSTITSTKDFSNNIVYGSSGFPSGTGNLISNPLLKNPGGGTIGTFNGLGNITRGNVDAYMLKTGSPAFGTGILVTSNGGRDYFGNAVSSTAIPNIGAYSKSTGVSAMAVSSKTETLMVNNDTPINSGFVVYPNPLSPGQAFKVNYYSDKLTDAKMTIMNNYGKVIKTQSVRLLEGQNTIDSLMPGNASIGSFYLFLNTGTKNLSSKIIVP